MSTKNFIDGRQNKIIWQIVASIMAIGMAGRAANGQTTNAPPDSGSSTNVTKLENTTVIGKLDVARNQIVPNLGATAYTHTSEQIEAQSQGADAPFNQVILRSPGVAGDSAANGDLHVRGEHANLQYRINDVLLPEGISGFGLELDPRFIQSLQLITGSLPAQYGFRTAGVVDIQTKSGVFDKGGEIGVYGGSYDTLRPSFELGGSKGSWNYFIDGSYYHSGIGIENPTPSSTPIHDDTDQYRTFLYASKVIDDTSRITMMGSGSYSTFQVPNTPGLPPGTNSDTGMPWGSQMATFNSSTNSVNLNENQKEQNYYGVVAYQKSVGDLNYQAAVYGRVSTVHFTPDPVGDLFFNGVASDVNRKLYSGGFQFDASYELNPKHTLRAGVMLLDEYLTADSTTTVFNPADSMTIQSIVDNHVLHALFAGVYLQDEWKILPKVTINYGARFDEFYSSFDKENQLSPRVNIIYQPCDTTTMHIGYSRYFTPPPLENISGSSIAKFNGTSNQAKNPQDDPVKAERANYFDAGITQTLAPGLQVGVDGYYKYARNQLDDGLFGQTLILAAFNYVKGKVYGVEFPVSYTHGGFSTYANLAWSVAQGEDWNSSQFLFDPASLAYVKNHWIALDHDQTVSGSFGASYFWKDSCGGNTRVYADALYGSGLRTTVNTPNDSTVPAYYSVNLGAEHAFRIGSKQFLKARVDVVNVTDNIYALRNGSGIGVGAAQFGMRRGFFGSLSYAF